MIGEMDKAVLKASKELDNVVELDGKMNQLYTSIIRKNTQEKESILAQYLELYEKRKEVDGEIDTIAIYLERIASDLSKHMLNWHDKKRHKLNIKAMKSMIANEIKFIKTSTGNVVVDDGTR